MEAKKTRSWKSTSKKIVISLAKNYLSSKASSYALVGAVAGMAALVAISIHYIK